MNFENWKEMHNNRVATISDGLADACRFLRFIHKQNTSLWVSVDTNKIDNVIHELGFILPKENRRISFSDMAYGLIALYGDLNKDMPQ